MLFLPATTETNSVPSEVKMVAIGSNSCHNCGSVASLVTHWFQHSQTEYVFCQNCWGSELVITEQSPVQNQDEHPACQAVDETGSPCPPCLVAEGIKKTYPTAKKFVVITKGNMEEIEPGAHLAYTLNRCGFIYWHELFVKEIDWENEKMVVYEKTKTTGRGMHENEMNIQDLFEKQLCRKFIYDNGCLTFEESLKLAESMVGDGKYNLVCDNCEHTARFLKTGRKESLQVENALWYVFNLLCTNVPKFLRTPAVRSLAFTVAEILVGELVHQLAPHITASLLIGAESIAGIVVYLIIYMFDMRKFKKLLENHEISQDNFEDLRTILRYKLSGAAWGSIIGILVASPAGVFGFKGIALACSASFICSLIFSVILNNVAYWVVRKRNEKRFSNHLKNRLIAAHKE